MLQLAHAGAVAELRLVRPIAHLYGKTPEPATTEARIY